MSPIPDDYLNGDFSRFRAFADEAQAGVDREDQAQHCFDVATLLYTFLRDERDLMPADERAIVLAGYGHDLIEDTPHTAATIAEFIGEDGARVARFIAGASENPDAGIPAFVEQVTQSSEEVWLIKLCDLTANYESLVTHGLVALNPEKWGQVHRDQMEPMAQALEAVEFRKYPFAGERAKSATKIARYSFQSAYEGTQ